jgi:excisionase family DNA binding protein
MTTDEVAELTRIPEATLRYYRYLGTGPRSYKLGRKVLYDRADVEKWIAEQKAATSSGGARVPA